MQRVEVSPQADRFTDDESDLTKETLAYYNPDRCSCHRCGKKSGQKKSFLLLFTANSQTFGNPAASGGSTAAVAADFLMFGRFLLRRPDSDKEKFSYEQARRGFFFI